SAWKAAALPLSYTRSFETRRRVEAISTRFGLETGGAARRGRPISSQSRDLVSIGSGIRRTGITDSLTRQIGPRPRLDGEPTRALKTCAFACDRAISSAVEHSLHTGGVTSSILVSPTIHACDFPPRGFGRGCD